MPTSKNAALNLTVVTQPNLGLHFDNASINIPDGALTDGLNFRVKNGGLENFNLGWSQFGLFTANGAIRMIDNFILRSGVEFLIIGTDTDLYKFNTSTELLEFISPSYVAGTASASGTTVSGSGTLWDTAASHVSAGDKISFGSDTDQDPTSTWYTIDTITNDTALELTASAGTVGSGTYTIRKQFSGDESDVWNFDTFINAAGVEDQWYATNGIDNVVSWNGLDTFCEDLVSLGITKVKTMFSYKNMMIWANFEQVGVLRQADIINSALGAPEDLTTGISEQFTVHARPDPIKTLGTIGDNLVIYSERLIVMAQFVGDPLIFNFRVASSGVGPLSPNVVADFGDEHIFLGFDTQYTFDGVRVEETNSHVWREVIRRNDPTRRHMSFAHFDEENADLIWVVAQTTDAGAGTSSSPAARGFGQHYLEETHDPQQPTPHSQREMPFTVGGYYTRQVGLTWDLETSNWEDLNYRWNDQFFFVAFPLNLMGAADGKVYVLNESQNKPSDVGMNSYVLFGRLPVTDTLQRGMVRRIYPYTTQLTDNLNVKTRLYDHAFGEDDILDTQTFDMGHPDNEAHASVFRRGRWYSIEFGTEGPNEPWQLGGYGVETTPGGKR